MLARPRRDGYDSRQEPSLRQRLSTKASFNLKRASFDEGTGTATYRSGNATLVVYQSEFAGTNKATTATWGLGADFDASVPRVAGLRGPVRAL